MQIFYHSFYSSPIQQENLTLKYVGLIHFQLDMNSVTENLKNFMVDGSIESRTLLFQVMDKDLFSARLVLLKQLKF